jgi:hypothetical protein
MIGLPKLRLLTVLFHLKGEDLLGAKSSEAADNPTNEHGNK